MGVQRQDLHVTADPVFTMQWAEDERVDEILSATKLPVGQPFAVLSVRSWPDMKDFARELAAVCDHLYNQHGLMSLFVLMQPESDRALSAQVMAQMTTPAVLLDQPLTPEELMGVVARGKLCLAMRLHTLIFAARTAVPLVGLVYDPKVKSYLQELGMPSAGDVSRLDRRQAILHLDELLKNYDRYKENLTEHSQRLARAAGENERLLLELLER